MQVGISPKAIEDNFYTRISDLSCFLCIRMRSDASDLNILVFEYLVIEGFSDAAVEFAHETGLPHDIDHEMIKERMEIRLAVEDGRVEEAIRRVNELDPEVCPFTSCESAPRISTIMHHA